jgi:GNAT superfamily N-acetyltransferase
MAVEIRPATRADARAIAEVHVASWRWAYRDLLPGAVLDGLSVDRREEMWRSVLAALDERTVALLALDGGTVIGFGSAGAAGDPDAPATEAEVFTLYLLEPYAGRGIGRELFAGLLDALRAQGYTRATLWVLEANQRTRRFYEAAGWRADGARDLYEIGGEGYPEVRYATEL